MKKSLHIATVGQKSEPIIEGIKAYPIDHLVLLYDKESAFYAEEIEKIAFTLKIKCEKFRVDAFDMEDIFAKIIHIHRVYKEEELYINITGGTKIMSTATFIAGFLIGANIYYIKEAKENESLKECIIELPVPKVQLENIEHTQQKILILIHENSDKIENGTTTISEKLRMKPQNVSYHIKRLEQANLIKNEKKGRSNIISLTRAGRFAARYFQMEGVKDSK